MEKNLNFKRLAERRVTRILEFIRLIGNLSNKNNYTYSDAEVDKIFRTIHAALDEVRGNFKKNSNPTNFKL